MSADDLGLDDEGVDDKSIRATFDGRAQYHRLALALEANIVRFKIEENFSLWLDALRSLYDHSEAFFTDEERNDVMAKFSTADKDLLAIQSTLRLKDRNISFARFKRTLLLKEQLHVIHRTINRARNSHGLLLPTSMGAGELDIDDLLQKMGVSNDGGSSKK